MRYFLQRIGFYLFTAWAAITLNFFIPRKFNWAQELPRLSLLNRRIFQVHAIFIVLVLGMLAAHLLTCVPALLEPTG